MAGVSVSSEAQCFSDSVVGDSRELRKELGQEEYAQLLERVEPNRETIAEDTVRSRIRGNATDSDSGE